MFIFIHRFNQLANIRMLSLASLFSILINVNSSAQTLEWAKSFGGIYSDFGISITTDAFGNVYTTGNFDEKTDFDPGPNMHILSPNGNNDIFIHKMDSQGNFLWVKTYGGFQAESGYAIAADATGHVYTTGYFSGTIQFDSTNQTNQFTASGGGDMFVLKMDPEGNVVWVKTMGGPKGDTGYSIALDDSGNVYTTGWFGETVDFDPGVDTFLLTSIGNADIFVHKMDTHGNFLWAKSFGGIDGDYGYTVKLDALGNVYTTGNFLEMVDFDPGTGVYQVTCTGLDDSFVHKLDANGEFQWVKITEGSAGVYVLSMEVDNFGNVYTLGAFRDTIDYNSGSGADMLISAGLNDIFIQKMDSNGQLLWTQSYGSPGRDVGLSLDTDDSGNVYTIGSFSSTVDFDASEGIANLTSIGKGDVFIQKMDGNGNFLWAQSFGGMGSEDGYAINVDQQGNICASGIFEESAVLSTGEDSIYLTSVGYDDVFILKLNQTTSALPNAITSLNLTVYPNPTFDFVNISFENPISKATLTMTDVQGKLVYSKQLDNESRWSIPFNSSTGVYFLHVKTSDSQHVVKIIKE